MKTSVLLAALTSLSVAVPALAHGANPLADAVREPRLSSLNRN